MKISSRKHAISLKFLMKNRFNYKWQLSHSRTQHTRIFRGRKGEVSLAVTLPFKIKVYYKNIYLKAKNLSFQPSFTYEITFVMEVKGLLCVTTLIPSSTPEQLYLKRAWLNLISLWKYTYLLRPFSDNDEKPGVIWEMRCVIPPIPHFNFMNVL